MDVIQSKAASEAYRENYDRIFGSGRQNKLKSSQPESGVVAPSSAQVTTTEGGEGQGDQHST